MAMHPQRRPGPPNLDQDDATDQINAWIAQTSCDHSLQAVLDEYGDSFQHMRAAVTALSEHELTELDHYPWLQGYALADVITHSFEHLHADHEPVLRAWLDQRKQIDA